MANWCSNTVVFEGTKQSNRYNSYSNQWLKRNRRRMRTVTRICSEHNGGYFFEIYQNDDVTGVFQYETKWSPM
jgi:LAS superfamily LD-carboxypeptidase LdcB